MDLSYGSIQTELTKRKYRNYRTEPWKTLFKKLQNSIMQYYKELKILEFPDLLHLENCLFMSQIETIPKCSQFFCWPKVLGNSHNYQTKSKTKLLLSIPLLNTQIYGTQSFKYNCIKNWDSFRNNIPDLLPRQCTYPLIKKEVKNVLISKY